ncbi:unnamed protein product [Didymodactylos carnosus]|uniref:FERM domain-containing protein n=1 Tax=Didymodactylos carnosus TaxID=1234261 RepID=A0A8S2EDJ9_9BILA|nr:unnamed protein product [Didymodactylos carnosus]CAF3890260.1 unnamed protein product [Didymodactylos carnosus]
MPISVVSSSTTIPTATWNLTILTTAVTQTTVVVKGDMHIGRVMVQLVNLLDVSQDWSDFALWWPEKNIWLTNTKYSLDQYGVQADALLVFTSMHKQLRIQLPDFRIVNVRTDFSTSVFASICKLGKQLGIRYPEELSFTRHCQLPLKTSVVRGTSPSRRKNISGNSNLYRHNSMGDSLAHNTTTNSTLFCARTPKLNGHHQQSHSVPQLSKSLNSLEDFEQQNLAQTPLTPVKQVLNHLSKPKSLLEKAKINGLWLDSSISLMEQNINENDLISLRFKYYTFFDLNAKYDAVRINQLYEQAKWSIISEEIDCTEEEMMMFAALQVCV